MSGDTITSYDFKFDYTTPIQDLQVTTYQNAISPGFESDAEATIQNVGNQYAASGTVTLHYPSILILEETSPPFDTHTDTTLIWNFTDFDAYESLEFNADFIADIDLSVIGDDVFTISIVEPLIGDYDTSNNSDTAWRTVTASVDPNHKLVYPAGIGETGNINPETEWLEYIIEFQNTGTDVAHFINIIDTLDSNLELTSFQMPASSHNYTVELTAPNIIEWNFDNIMLPDSGADYLGSMGYVQFKIRIADAATEGIVITNTAAIYFDYNTPVITNTTVTTLALPTGISDHSANHNFTIYPNPAGAFVVIGLESPTNQILNYKIVDMNGKFVLKGTMKNGLSAVINTTGLSAGSYFIYITDLGLTKVLSSKNFVVIR
jgi:hypothetical protein